MAPPIAYLGGSVTQQRRGAYRPLLHGALCERFGRVRRPVNAGVGGVGSISGLFLVDDLVLRHGPELCFVEFATTDTVGGTPLPMLKPVLEALIARLREGGCEPCFLLLGRLDGADVDHDEVLAVYHQVADANQVLCIDLARELGADASYFRDVVHTSDKGGAKIAEEVAAAVGPVSPALGPPVRQTAEPDFSGARLIPAAVDQLADQRAGEPGSLGDLFPYLRVRPGNGFNVEFDGELVGLVITVGPTAGGVRVTVGESNDAVSESALTWDFMCHYERLSTVVFKEPKPAGSPLRIEAVHEAIDYGVAFEPPPEPWNIAQDLRLVAYMVRS